MNSVNLDLGATPASKTFRKTAIIGRGQISSHVPAIFKPLIGKHIFFDRETDYSRLDLSEIDAVFLAVQDKNIESVYFRIRPYFKSEAQFFHLSGSLTFDGLIGLHPLMTFAPQSKIEDYSSIPIFTDNEVFFSQNKDVFKNLKSISPDLKTKYHAMAVMLGNFSQYYLQLVKNNFPNEFNFEDYKNLTLVSVENIFNEDSAARLTGPLIRDDVDTIQKHKDELSISEPSLSKIYLKMNEMFKQKLFSDED